MSGPENIIGIGVELNADQAIAAEDKLITSTDAMSGSFDGASASVDKLGQSLNLAGRKIQLSAADAEMLDKAMGGVSGEMDAAAASTERYTGAVDGAVAGNERFVVSAEQMMASQEAMAGKQAEMAINTKAANAALGSTYVGMSKLEQLGTPAIMKAATWSILGVGGIAYEGIKQYMNFNKLITQTITQAGVPASQMGYLTKMTESISKMTGVNLNDVANSLYRVASGTASWNDGLGASMAQLKNITTAVTKLQVLGAIPSGAASEQSARVITAMVNSNLIGTGRNPSSVAALVNATVGSGDMRQNDLVPGIGRGVLQSAKANGMSAQDMMSWIAALTSMGTTASVAGNYVKTGINLLANPSAQGVLAEAMIGIKPGELAGLISSKGGLQSAVATFDQAMSHFAPASGMVSYRTPEGFPRPQSPGEIGAINKLQTWMVGEMNPTVLKQWEHGGSAASGGLTAQNAQWVQDLIMTKAFGGSKQFATLAAILKNPTLLAGVETSIGKKSSLSYLESSYAIASNTPSQRFHKDLASIQVDLVNAGKALYPAVIKMTDGVTWFVDHLVSWKPAIIEIGAAMLGMVALAGAVKVAGLYTGAKAMIGGIYTRFDPNGTSGSTARAAYQVKTAGTIADLGAQIRAAEDVQFKATEGTTAAVKTGVEEMVGAQNRTTEALLELSGSRGISSVSGVRGAASSLPTGMISGSGGLGTTGIVQLRDPKTGRFLSLARSAEIANMETLAASDAAAFGYTARGVRQRMPGAMGAFMSNAQISERASLLAQEGSAASYGYAPRATAVSVGTWDTGAQMASIPTDSALNLTRTGDGFLSKMSKLGAGALGMVGGPIGLAMIASTVLPLAVPYMMKGLSAMSHWFGGATNSNAITLSSIGPKYVQTGSQITANVDAYKKQIAQLNNGGYNPLTATAAQTAQWQNLHIKLNSSQAALAGLNPSQQLAQFKKAWGITNNAGIQTLLSDTGSGGQYNFGKSFNMSLSSMPSYMMGSIMSGLTGDIKSLGNMPGAAQLRQEIAGATGHGKAYNSLSYLTPGQLSTKINGQVAAMLLANQNLLATPEGQAALYGNKIPGVNHYSDYLSAQGVISRQANYTNLGQSLTLNGLNNSNSTQREESATLIASKLVGLAQSDLVRSNASGIGAGASGLYKAAAKKAEAEAVAFQQLRNEMINKLDGQKLDKGSIKDLATEITNQQRQLYNELRLTGADIGSAFSAALGVSGSALANIVNKANAKAKARG